jgi:multidrug efflux system outer membrane protein
MKNNLIFLVLVALTGCQPFTPVKIAPLPTLPAIEVSADLRNWVNAYQDPQLISIITAAERGNRSIHQAHANLKFARASTLKAKALNGPALSLGASYDSDEGGYAASVLLNWEFNLGQQADFDQSANQAREHAQAFHLAAIGHAIRLQVIEAYWDFQYNERTLAILKAERVDQEKSLIVLVRRQQLGLSTSADFTEAQRSIKILQRDAIKIKEQRDLSLQVLRTLSHNQALIVSVHDQPTYLSTLTPSESLKSDLLLQRPDVLEARQRLLASGFDIRSAEAEYFPSFSLNTKAGLSSNTLLALASGNPWSLLSMTLDLPLYDGGLRKAQVDRASAVEQEAMAIYEARVQGALSDMHNALTKLNSEAEQLQALKAEKALAENALHAAMARQALHAKPQDVLDARNIRLATRMAAEDAILRQLIAHANLHHALGL